MTSMQFFLYPVTFFGNPILAMVNGVLLLPVVSLPRAVQRGEAARRREIVGRGGEKQGGRGERVGRKMEEKRRVSGRRCFTVWQIHIDHNGSAANGGECSVTRDLH